ncbi:CASP plant-like protein [Medicago truncatula]|uniref:CASP plant-like protein n=1 Tax=Medicago truncatula TaxID=3880 RepID=G7L5R6_MEDTR|nr:CASP plant-like protein [Medicago truncatula]
MNVSHASIHQIEEVPTTDVRMKDIQGMPNSVGGLYLRILQFIFFVDALSVMAFTSYFRNIKHLPSISFGEREGFW